MLSFGGLLYLFVTGGSPGLVASNPGIVKVLGGFVFPVGLVMWASLACISCNANARFRRIVLLGLELLTSNMMVRCACNHSWTAQLKPFSHKVFPMAVWTKAVPWWSLPLNWIVGESKYSVLQAVLLTVLHKLQWHLETLWEVFSSRQFWSNVRTLCVSFVSCLMRILIQTAAFFRWRLMIPTSKNLPC